MIISLVECNANLRPHSPFHGEYCHSKDAEGASEGWGGVAAIIRSTQKGQRKGKEKGGDKKVARSLQVVEQIGRDVGWFVELWGRVACTGGVQQWHGTDGTTCTLGIGAGVEECSGWQVSADGRVGCCTG